MKSSEDKRQAAKTPEDRNRAEAAVPEINTDFMKEEIRQRPLNKKRLLRRTAITAFLAVLFGAVACAVFLLLEPVINRAITPTEEPAAVTFPEETAEDEVSPEDMIASDEEIQEAAAEKKAASLVDVDAIRKEVLEEVKKDLADSQKEEDRQDAAGEYSQLYASLQELAGEASKAVVTVSVITSDYDWAGDLYNRSGSVSGLIVAQKGTSLLILAGEDDYAEAEQIRVQFQDGQSAEASVLAQDSITGLTILSVDEGTLKGDFAQNDQLAVAALGSSDKEDLVGSPVIAVGSPAGTAGSVSYGVVTNAGLALDVTDSSYQQISTDISGSKTASGILVDMNGSVIGWIDMQYQTSDAQNLICATGITGVKPLIEKLSNETSVGYLGIHTADVPENVQKEQSIPEGAYVLKTEMDSPAMEAGIQSGDVIMAFAGKPVRSCEELTSQLLNTRSGRQLSIQLKRPSGENYTDVTLVVNLGSRITLGKH